MQIGKIGNLPSFNRALPKSKKEDFKKTAFEAEKILGIDNGLSVLQIHSASIPRQDFFDTGIGKLNSQSALDYIEKMAFYTGSNAVKEFPKGETKDIGIPYFCPYLKSATTFGEETINLYNIASNKKFYGDMLKEEDIAFLKDDNSDFINYRNELALGSNQPILKPLKTAYKRYKLGCSTKEFEREFEEYKNTKRVKENYPRFALYPFIGTSEADLFKDFDLDEEKQEKFEQYKKQYASEIEFYQFRQFLAYKEHNEAKKKINEKGIKLFGDCLIGFSDAEVWANPDAFEEKGIYVGLPDWGLPSLKFDSILDKNSQSHKVFDDKVSFFLENYDGVRFDVGWCYAISQSGRKGQKYEDLHRVDLGHKLYDFIAKRAKEIKGYDFDTRNLAYESDGFFFDWKSDNRIPKPIMHVRDIMSIYTTEWQNFEREGWGHPYFYRRTGLNDDEFIMGTNNHDGENLKRLAINDDEKTYKKRVHNSIVLNTLFNIPLKTLINNPKEFIKAKFAELFLAKNRFLFFIDVMGSDEKMDTDSVNEKDYTYRLNKNYEEEYHTALQDGWGFNLMESLRLALKHKYLDKEYPEIYQKVSYYADYLYQKGAKTEQEADMEERII